MTRLERHGLLYLCSRWNLAAQQKDAFASSTSDRADKDEARNAADTLRQCAQDLYQLLEDEVEP